MVHGGISMRRIRWKLWGASVVVADMSPVFARDIGGENRCYCQKMASHGRERLELRHLRCFVVLAEELHFTRAAERLHIEQSPLSRTIKELEDELGVLLFDRDRRGTRLTQAGEVFLQDVRRVFATLELARENVKAVSSGYLGILRIAVPSGCIDPRLSTFRTLPRGRSGRRDTSNRGLADRAIARTPFRELQFGVCDTAEVGDGIIAEPVWVDSVAVAVAARHPLLVHKQIPWRT
jgi:DNA-binding transcriptional LysR family regulator